MNWLIWLFLWKTQYSHSQPANSKEAGDDNFHLRIAYHVPGTVVRAFHMLYNLILIIITLGGRYYLLVPLYSWGNIGTNLQSNTLVSKWWPSGQSWPSCFTGTSMPVHWHRGYGCFWATMTEMNSCDWDLKAQKAWNIYGLSLYRKCPPAPNVKHG